MCRHEFGTFYPANDDGFYTKIGEGPGLGYNINVPWENGRCGDADYLAAWEHVLIPVANEFSPDLIIVSAGFDAGLMAVTSFIQSVSSHLSSLVVTAVIVSCLRLDSSLEN